MAAPTPETGRASARPSAPGRPWTAAGLAALAADLARGAADLHAVSDEDLLDAWSAAVEVFLDPRAPERRTLEGPLTAACRLSPSGLAAALDAVLGGVRRPAAAALLERAATLRAAHAGRLPHGRAGGVGGARPAPTPVLVVLAANLPALAVQPLLPCLALRRPVLLKSPSAEPHFAPAFLAALTAREPRLAPALAAATWPGGDPLLEAPLLEAAGTVLAYGSADAVADLERRAPGKVIAYGPKTSLAVVDPDPDEDTAQGLARDIAHDLARDIARFDQRGCLSIAAVYVKGGIEPAAALATKLEQELEKLAALWEPGPPDPAALAQVQHLRLESAMRGLPAPHLPIAAGTVILEPDPAFHPSPGLRTVRIHPLPDLDRLPHLLAPWQGRLQGAALAGPAAWRLAPRLTALGFSRLTPPGHLQSPDATWHNGGIDPLEALSLPNLP